MKQLKAVWYLYDDGSREYVDQCQPLVTPRSMLRSFLQGLKRLRNLLQSASHEAGASALERDETAQLEAHRERKLSNPRN